MTLSSEMNLTTASLTPADKLFNSTVAVPLVTVPLNDLPSTVMITVPFALSEILITALVSFG